MKAVIYLRKSTDKEDNQVLSLESQRDFCEQLAKKEGIEVVEIIEESMSASSPGRPGFARLLSMMGKNGVDTIITWKLNRIARNPIDAGSFSWCLQGGLLQKTYTSDGVYTPETNVLLISVLFGMSSQYTVELKKDIARGMRTAVSKGQMISKAPKGYKNDKNTKEAVMTEEASFIKSIFQMRTDGMSFGDISKKLKKLGYKMPEETVARTIANRFYYGVVHFRGEYFSGKHEPLVTKEEWDQANKKQRGRWSKNKFPLKGIVKVSGTDEILTASFSRGKSGGRFLYYHQKRGDIRVSEKKIFEAFETFLPCLDIPESRNEEFMRALLDCQKKDMLTTIEQTTTIEKRKKALQAKAEGLFDMRMAGDIESDVYKQKNAEIHDQIMECDKQIRKIENHSNDTKEKTLHLFEHLKKPFEYWKTLSDVGKSSMIKDFSFELHITNGKDVLIQLSDVLQEVYNLNATYGGGDVGKFELLYRALKDTPLEKFKQWSQNRLTYEKSISTPQEHISTSVSRISQVARR